MFSGLWWLVSIDRLTTPHREFLSISLSVFAGSERQASATGARSSQASSGRASEGSDPASPGRVERVAGGGTSLSCWQKTCARYSETQPETRADLRFRHARQQPHDDDGCNAHHTSHSPRQPAAMADLISFKVSRRGLLKAASFFRTNRAQRAERPVAPRRDGFAKGVTRMSLDYLLTTGASSHFIRRADDASCSEALIGSMAIKTIPVLVAAGLTRNGGRTRYTTSFCVT